MKFRIYRALLLLLALCLCVAAPSACAPAVKEPVALSLSSLGVPYQGLSARNPWDMIAYGGYLYVGAGDYDDNISPDVLMRMSLDTLKWEALSGYEDEQIERFLLLDGKLYIPGIDAKEDWSYGNYYTVEGDTLRKHRVLQGGVHVWDMASYDGKLFASLGSVEGDSPLLVSEDGAHFEEVPFVERDGNETLCTTPFYTLRVYDLMQVDGDLYAIVTRYAEVGAKAERLLYCYAPDGAMHYVCPLSDTLTYVRLRYFPIISKVPVGDSLLFSTGKLYRTEDMRSFTDITPKDTTYIADIIEAEGKVYALGFTPKEDGVTLLNNLYRYEADGSLTLIAYFESAVPPLAFTVVGNRFFVALNKMNGVLDYQGEIFYGSLEP